MTDLEQVVIFVSLVILTLSGIGLLVSEIKDLFKYFKDKGDRK